VALVGEITFCPSFQGLKGVSEKKKRISPSVGETEHAIHWIAKPMLFAGKEGESNYRSSAKSRAHGPGGSTAQTWCLASALNAVICGLDEVRRP
jgi:hypothetical protein